MLHEESEVSAVYLAERGCYDLLEKNDSSALQCLKKLIGIKFLDKLIQNAFSAIDKEKSDLLFKNIDSIEDKEKDDKALKNLLMAKYHALFKQEENLDAPVTPRWQPFMPMYLMIKDKPEATLVSETESQRQRQYLGLTGGNG